MSSEGGTGAPSAAQVKTERLLNLVLVLLYTRRPLSKAQIRQLVPQYGQSASSEAFERMFERDKDELRELGIPLVTEDIDPLHEDEPGYRIHQREYALPDISFEADELAVLGLASRTWAQASLAGPAAQALRKLRAAGVERDVDALIGIEPRLRTTEPAFDAVKDGVLRRVPLTFSYRRPEAAEASERHVQPWSLVSWHGRWYLNAFDVDRGAARAFRLSRIVGPVRTTGRAGSFEVPDDHEPELMVQRVAQPPSQPSPAVLRVRRGTGHSLRRRARTVGEVDQTWDLVDLDHTDLEDFAEELAGYGADVVVEAPPELVDSVVRRLRGALASHGGVALMAGFTQETATARLARLLTMVPWLVNRQGIDLQQAADDLGVSVEQLEADLNLLFLCGYGQLPDELIEADWEEGRVFVGNADTIARPLRLGVDEAVTLVVGLRALREVPGLGERDAVDRALAKLEDAAGAAAAPARRVRAEVADGASPEVLARARQAIADHRRVHLRYLVPGRDETTERDVDPMRVVGMDGRWYLEGWCHRAEDTRMFRIDRVEELTVLDVDGTPPAEARERDLSEGTFRPAPDDLVVTLRLLPGATWVADYYPVESLEDVPAADGGGLLVRMRTADTAWLRRLVWRLGGRGVVLDPPEVVAEIREGAAAALTAYPQTAGG